MNVTAERFAAQPCPAAGSRMIPTSRIRTSGRPRPNPSFLARAPLAFIALTLLVLVPAALRAAIIGTNVPARPLTPGRIAELPPSQQAAWNAYLEQSSRQKQTDQETFQQEMKRHNVRRISSPAAIRSRQALRSNRPAEWYAQAEAKRLAENVISFQTPAGGWSKNIDMTSAPRPPGMLYALNESSRLASAADFEIPASGWSYVGTIDNDATTMQLRFLARVISARGTNGTSHLRASFLKGLDYLFASQYPNGGWPQVWPLAGGYHDAVTFNDNAIVNVLNLLQNVAAGEDTFDFVPAPVRERARDAFNRGLRCVLDSQVVVDGTRKIWPQQSDALTLKPTSARNFEMVALASSESAALLQFLMRLPAPTTETSNAVHAAAAWFQKNAIRDKDYRSTGPQGRFLVDSPGHGPLWARYSDVRTDRPLFGDRDKTIHDVVDQISQERRAGYAWFTDSPEGVLKEYSRWRE